MIRLSGAGRRRSGGAGGHGDLSFLYVLSVICAPRDVTVDEIAVEAMFPAAEATREALLAINHE